jgi:hypothetical protein
MKTILLASAFALGAGAASAASITFDLLGAYDTNEPSLNYSAGGVDLKVEGLRCDNSNKNCGAALIDQYGTGIGMDGGGGDSHQVDGSNYNEFLTLSFSEEVQFSSVSFTYYSAGDDFEFFTHTGSAWSHVGRADACESNCGNSSTINKYDFLGTYVGTAFMVGSMATGDDWKLRAVTVDYTDDGNGNLPPVPLPAAGWMLLAGLGGLGAMKRRQKSA